MSIVPTANHQMSQTSQNPQLSSSASLASSSNASGKQSTSSDHHHLQFSSSHQSSQSSSSSNQFANLNVNALSSMSSLSSSTNKQSVSSSSSTNTNQRASGQILSIASMIPSQSSSSMVNNNKSSTSAVEQSRQQSQQQLQQQTRPVSPHPLQSVNQQQPTNQPVSQPQPTQQQPIYDDINIFMWSVCKMCNRSTKKIAMSPDTWSFSLAKFLELTFHARNYHQYNSNNDLSSACEHDECCKHSLFQDNYQYFRFKNIVCVFSTSKIIIKTLHIPEVSLKSSVSWYFAYTGDTGFFFLFGCN